MEQVLEVKTDTDTFTLHGRACELSSYSFIPPKRNNPPERTVFNSTKEDQYPQGTFDRLYREPELFNNKLHRDDREHAKSRGLCVNDEEKKKKVPTLSSSEYGHRLDMAVDNPDRAHVRIGVVRAEFLRKNGIPPWSSKSMEST